MALSNAVLEQKSGVTLSNESDFSHKLALRTNPKVFRAMAALLEQVWGLP